MCDKVRMTTSIRSYSLGLLRGLTAAEVSRLKKSGIDSTAELLAVTGTTHQERALAKKVGISHARIREAVNRADLVRVSGIGPATADLFENAGVNSAKELAQRNAQSLAATLAKYVDAHPELNYRLPSPTTVASLIAKAKVVAEQTGEGPATTARATKYLKMEVVRWYLDHGQNLPPGANNGFEAQVSVKPQHFSEVTDPEDNPHGHDLAKFKLFRHPDVVFPGSDRAWFVVFERATGKFVEAYDFN